MSWLLWLACFDGRRPRPPDGTPNNVVWIVVDTLRADHLGAYGYARPTSPRLDTFAEHAAVFEMATSHAPWTKPSMATMLTGLLPRDHGVDAWESVLDPDLPTVQRALKDAGYATTAVVSHHALDPRFSQFHLGFDRFDTSAFAGRGSAHDLITSHRVTDVAIEALESLPEPFFLFVHYFDPHETYMAHPATPFGTSDVDLYDAEIAFTDHALGRLFDRLDALGMAERTARVVVADHGEEFGDHGGRVHTLTLYDEAIRVPLLVAGPGIAAGRVPGRVGLVHLGPTVLDLVGVSPPPGMAGRPIPRVDGRFAPRPEPIVSETRRYVDRRSVVDGSMKLIVDLGTGHMELYDWVGDPGEQRNLASLRPAVVSRMSRFVESYERGRNAARQEPMAPELRTALEELGYIE
jgi:arylsulfatase A-like enzyme